MTLGKLLTPIALEGSPVSSLKCDRWHRSDLERCLADVCAISGILIAPSHVGCVTALGPWLARWPARHRLAHGRPMGVDGRAGETGRPTGQLCGLAQEKQT